MEPLRTPRVLSRRTWLRLGAGGLATAGLGRIAWALGEPGLDSPDDRRALILLWLDGGPSQLETFDPHPGKAIAAGTKAIPTAVPGIEIAAGFERLAEQMRDVSLVRALVSKEGDHERATAYVRSGYRPNPTLRHPSIGAILCEQLPQAGVEIPRHVSILPGQWPGRGGFLGARYDAFAIGDPAGRLPDVQPRVSTERTARRFEDLEVVEEAFRTDRAAQHDATRHRDTVAAARTMMGSPQLSAFDVSQEPAAVRERYGDTAFGRGCLAARRLIEVGVRCIEVTLDGWDTHVDNHENVRPLVETLDQALSALIADLREREMLAHTVVLCGGEFGRTPRINKLQGRDHWPHGFTWAVAGGGLRGGHVVGSTDPEGGREVQDPRTIADVHATVLSTLGIDPEIDRITSAGRPVRLSDGTPIRALLA